MKDLDSLKKQSLLTLELSPDTRPNITSSEYQTTVDQEESDTACY